jgi:hypothetical protein
MLDFFTELRRSPRRNFRATPNETPPLPCSSSNGGRVLLLRSIGRRRDRAGLRERRVRDQSTMLRWRSCRVHYGDTSSLGDSISLADARRRRNDALCRMAFAARPYRSPSRRTTNGGRRQGRRPMHIWLAIRALRSVTSQDRSTDDRVISGSGASRTRLSSPSSVGRRPTAVRPEPQWYGGFCSRAGVRLPARGCTPTRRVRRGASR